MYIFQYILLLLSFPEWKFSQRFDMDETVWKCSQTIPKNIILWVIPKHMGQSLKITISDLGKIENMAYINKNLF